MLAINFRQPCVIDEASGFRQAGALVAGFGFGNTALLDVLTGKAKPQGKLPFALANNLQAVIDNLPDAPGYPAKDTLYPFGFGLGYQSNIRQVMIGATRCRTISDVEVAEFAGFVNVDAMLARV